MHRSRTLELKDGNPANEVRMLSVSIMSNENILAFDRTIKYVPEKTILKLNIGDKIILNLKDFTLLIKAYFTEIQSNFLSQ